MFQCILFFLFTNQYLFKVVYCPLRLVVLNGTRNRPLNWVLQYFNGGSTWLCAVANELFMTISGFESLINIREGSIRIYCLIDSWSEVNMGTSLNFT